MENGHCFVGEPLLSLAVVVDNAVELVQLVLSQWAFREGPACHAQAELRPFCCKFGWLHPVCLNIEGFHRLNRVLWLLCVKVWKIRHMLCSFTSNTLQWC